MRPIVTLIDNLLTPDECQLIIDLNKDRLESAYLSNKVVDTKIRRSKIAWINPRDPNTDPRLRGIIDKCNYHMSQAAKKHDIELKVFELPQFTQYTSFGHYNKHCDVAINGGKRILSATIELSNSNDYYGGGISIQCGSDNHRYKRSQGSMVIFPSILTHQANTVWWGTRYSLVLWGIDHNTIGDKR